MLSADKEVYRKDGVQLPFKLYQAVKIYTGALVAVNAAGYALPGADTAGLIFQGISIEQVDNSLGLSGAKDVTLHRRGCHLLEFATAITIANIGDNVFLAGDDTVDVAGNVTNHIFCGCIAEYVDSTHAYVDIEPAIRQADVATHIADSSAAPAASAISIADAGTLTTAAQVQAALQDINQHLLSAQKFLPVPLTALRELTTGAIPNAAGNGGLLASDTTPVLSSVNGDTDGALRVSWAASNSDAIGFQVPLPPDLDDTADVVIHVRAAMSGTTDTPVIDADSYFNEGDTKVEDASAAITGASYAEYTITIGAADVPAGAQTLSVEITPAAHTTDALYVTAVWIEYKAKLLTA
jgi:hypothetical protein